MKKITILAVDNCMLSSVIGCMDLFSIANFWWQQLYPKSATAFLQTEIVSPGCAPIHSFNAIPFRPDKSIQQVKKTDVIIIPSLMHPIDAILQTSQDTVKWLRHHHARSTWLASVCTGAFLLAETGLLDGKTATTHWKFVSLFKERYPEVQLKPQRLLTDEGNLLCSGGTTSYLDLSLHLVERLGSEELAIACAKSMVMDRHRHLQTPYLVLETNEAHNDAEILQVQKQMEKHFRKPLGMQALADSVGMSPRNFKRRFKQATGDTPLAYLQRLRIEAAKKLLETTLETFERITYQVGYEDSSSFRRLFKKTVGVPPKVYRHKFNRTLDGDPHYADVVNLELEG